MTSFGILFIAFIFVSIFASIMTSCFIVSYKKAREFEKELECRKKKKF